MQSPRFRRLLLIVGIAIASVVGLLFVLEYAPLKWQVWLTPAYRSYQDDKRLDQVADDAEEKLRQGWVDHWTKLAERIEPGQEWVGSDDLGVSLRVEFVRAELERRQKAMEEFQATRTPPGEPSYLRFLFERIF